MEHMLPVCPLHGVMVEENGVTVCLVCSQVRPNIISEVTRPSTRAEIADQSGSPFPLIPSGKASPAPTSAIVSSPQSIIDAIERLTMPSDLKKCKTILKLKQLAQSLLED